jgi:transcriptional regulator with GAF, ATPase, and Fis domain
MEAENDARDDIKPESTLDPAAPLSDDSGIGVSTRLKTIYEIGRQLLEQREPQEVILTIQQAVVRHLKPDHACILAVGEDGAFRPLSSHRLDLVASEEDWPLSRSALRQAQRTGLALLATDTVREPEFAASGSIHRLSICSLICVPMGKHPVRGLIYVDNRGEDKRFTREDLEFLTAVSLYASLVLERVEDHVQTRAALERSDERLELLQGELLRCQIVGKSPALLAAYEALRRFGRAGARVFLRGETGTGKELFARAYALASNRYGKAYVPVPIPALAPTLIESELFGHVRGAFTEATRDKKGRLELANGGVLFLDEVGDIEPALQAKLLRFLDSGELHRVGDTETRSVDALIVSATNRPLEKLVEEGRFRPDLLARLGHAVTLPPLRERPEDVPLLVEHFVNMYDRSERKKVFAPETLELLQQYRWEFNVRQLQQVVERAVCLVDRETILPEDLPEFLSSGSSGTAAAEERARDPAVRPDRVHSLREVTARAERAHILQALELAGGNRRRAIQMLQISSETFYRRLKDLGLHKKKAGR